MELKNNKILVTGATDGIGKALTKELLKYDNTIIAVGRAPEKLKELKSYSEYIIPFKCDLSQSSEIDRLAAFIEEEHPDLNILINNAGIQHNYQLSVEPQIFTKIKQELNVNTYAPIMLTGLLLPTIRQNENAAIVNVTSSVGLVPKEKAAVYSASKAALHLFTKALRLQLDKVNVFEIIPPLVDTQMTKGRGKGKISPGKVSREFITHFANDNYEIIIGKAKLLGWINRMSPTIAEKIINGSDS